MLDAMEAIHSQRNQVCRSGVHALSAEDFAWANFYSKHGIRCPKNQNQHRQECLCHVAQAFLPVWIVSESSQEMLLDFSECVARKFFYDDELSRYFERCQLCAAAGFEFFRVDLA
jgi:hypothetical protein